MSAMQLETTAVFYFSKIHFYFLIITNKYLYKKYQLVVIIIIKYADVLTQLAVSTQLSSLPTLSVFVQELLVELYIMKRKRDRNSSEYDLFNCTYLDARLERLKGI